MKIVCVGEVTIDKYIGGDYLAGGTSFNVSKILKRINPDRNVSLISAVGNDEYGTFLKKQVIKSGVTPMLQELDGISSQIEIKLIDNERHLQNYEAGILEKFELSDDQKKVLQESDIAIYVCFKEVEQLFISSLTFSKKALKVVDFTDLIDYGKDLSIVKKVIEKVDILFFGLQKSDEKIILELELMAKKYNKLIIVTLGKDGSLAYFKYEKFEVPAEKITNIVDTTGAGDAFIAGFIKTYLDKRDIDKSLKSGSIEASRAIQKIGI